MSQGRGRLTCIDFVRGLSALLVLGSHVRIEAWSGGKTAWETYGLRAPWDVWLGYLSYPFRFGFGGVTLFFVISGYCIHRANEKHFPKREVITTELGSFLWRRFVRIYPTLFFALLLTWLLDLTSRRYGVPSAQFDNSISTFFLNLFSLQAYLGKSFGSNYALWSLAIEEHIYLLYPLMLLFSRRFGISRLLFITFIISLVSSLLWERNQGVRLDLLPYWFGWTLGAYVAELENVGQKVSWLTLRYLPLFSLVGFLGLYFLKLNLLCQIVLSIGAASSLLWILDRQEHPFFRNRFGRFVAWVGSWSYSLYILHVPLLSFWVSLILRGNRPVSFLPALGATAFALGGSLLCFYCVERWSLKKLKNHKSVELSAPEQLSQAA